MVPPGGEGILRTSLANYSGAVLRLPISQTPPNPDWVPLQHPNAGKPGRKSPASHP